MNSDMKYFGKAECVGALVSVFFIQFPLFCIPYTLLSYAFNMPEKWWIFFLVTYSIKFIVFGLALFSKALAFYNAQKANPSIGLYYEYKAGASGAILMQSLPFWITTLILVIILIIKFFF